MTSPHPITRRSRGVANISPSLFSAPTRAPPSTSSLTVPGCPSLAKVNGPRRNMAGEGRRGWRKLHLGVDGSGVIVACAVTEPTADDATTGIGLVDQVDTDLVRVTADPAYDTLAFYGAVCARGARVVVPPTKTASLSRRRPRSTVRDRTIRRVKVLGRRRWKKASGYHQQARVENAFFRYKSSATVFGHAIQRGNGMRRSSRATS